MRRLTRRDFIKTGAKGIAIASLPAIFRFDPMAALAAPLTGQSKLSDYYAHFGVDEKVIREVMAVALERGGDYCDLFFEHSISSTIILDDNAVNRAYTGVDFGVGIRVIEGDRTGYSFTEEITLEAMKLAAKTAANIAGDTKNIPPVSISLHETPEYYPIGTLWEDVKVAEKIPYLQKINDGIVSKDKRIIKARVYFDDSSSYILVVTSDGRAVCDYRPMSSLSATCTAEQNGRREQNGYDIGGRCGLEYYTPQNVERVAAESVRRTIELFDAVKPEGGEMEVVLAAGQSGMMLHEAIGHGMEADVNRKGISIYADKIGKPIAENFINIVDDGTNLGLRGSLNVDDEGNDTQKTFLVENGILTSYMHDHISAAFYKVKPTGNGRRESFRYPAIPRMRNTYMLAGPHSKEEIIKSVKKGLYAETFTNGEVFIGAGDFTFYVQSGYLIEDGKLTRPVKDLNIIGNGPQVLKNVVMAAGDVEMMDGGGTCGKDGQGVPVSMGLPTVKVSSITVGGVSS
jgi:TldD protein